MANNTNTITIFKQIIDFCLDFSKNNIIQIDSINIFKIKYNDGFKNEHLKYLLNKILPNNIKISRTFIPTVDSIMSDKKSIMVNEMCDWLINFKNTHLIFHFSVIGNMNDNHMNLIVYNAILNEWVRIEPAGIKFYDATDNSLNYMQSDIHFKKYLINYISHNDYHILPGLHDLNNGPYCVFYASMILEEYLKRNNIHSAIEYLFDKSVISSKLKNYELIMADYT